VGQLPGTCAGNLMTGCKSPELQIGGIKTLPSGHLAEETR